MHDMAGGILIFCERSGAWAVAMRRELGSQVITQRETRSLAECQEALAEFPESLAVVELTRVNLVPALDWLAALPTAFPRARAIAVSERGMEQYEFIAREFGCLAHAASPRALAPVAALIGRYFEQLPRPAMSWREQVRARLPWPDSQPFNSQP